MNLWNRLVRWLLGRPPSDDPVSWLRVEVEAAWDEIERGVEVTAVRVITDGKNVMRYAGPVTVIAVAHPFGEALRVDDRLDYPIKRIESSTMLTTILTCRPPTQVT